MKIVKILKEIIDSTQQYQQLVDDVVDQGGQFIGQGDYGAVFLVGDKVVKITTDSEELEDAQQIKQQKTKYFVYIYDVEIRHAKLGTITMQHLKPFTGSQNDVPIDDIIEEADMLGICPDLQGPGGSIKMDNIMQDKTGRIKVIDV